MERGGRSVSESSKFQVSEKSQGPRSGSQQNACHLPGPSVTFRRLPYTFRAPSGSCVHLAVSRHQPIPESGDTPVVEIDLVEAGVAAVVKETDDVGVRAAVGEQGVKVVLDVLGKPAGFAAGFATLNLNAAIFNSDPTGFAAGH